MTAIKDLKILKTSFFGKNEIQPVYLDTKK
ncbi:hypothetical protein HMPREF1057_01140 [Bacteroides finegoldii CL09T03C10]|uniref:Uncharacterized protein n=1 Tax=Bacteroides finegoldii CL09T03C10 TaxID=997888 RepID=K5CSG0_9BACE|nr:hypothetical protein HMPREF1057_01140 [Bacteroides finegoldii CL09T03C10]